jgi:hypothetical protein
MLQIVQVTYEACGEIKHREAFPFLFPNRESATLFLETHLEAEYTGGRSGYERDDDRWWGCDDKPNTQIHHYEIRPRCAA